MIQIVLNNISGGSNYDIYKNMIRIILLNMIMFINISFILSRNFYNVHTCRYPLK